MRELKVVRVVSHVVITTDVFRWAILIRLEGRHWVLRPVEQLRAVGLEQ